jgi:hypothetical protein
VVWQLGEFREERALKDLHRVARFDVSAKEKTFNRTRGPLVHLAKNAIAKITNP